MLQQFLDKLETLTRHDAPGAELPVEATLAAGRFSVEMRRLNRGCGHSELLADVSLIDGVKLQLMLLHHEDLQDLCGLLRIARSLASGT